MPPPGARRKGRAAACLWPLYFTLTNLACILLVLYIIRSKHRLAALELFGNSVTRRSRLPPLYDPPQLQQVERIYWEQTAKAAKDLESLDRPFSGTGIVLEDRKAASRKLLWDFFPSYYNCYLKEKVGELPRNGDGGKWVCGLRTLLQRRECVVYSFGSNGEASFEKGILSNTPCETHVFDPTLNFEQQLALERVENLYFHGIGLGPADGVVHVDDMRLTMQRDIRDFEAKTLATLMDENAHEWVDLLKIDVEGHEWGILRNLLEQPVLPFTQLQVELHWWGPDSTTTVPHDMLEVLRNMTQRGLRVFSTEPNMAWTDEDRLSSVVEYAFLQVDDQGHPVGPDSLQHPPALES